jgi:small-conductance mechanosensitive channel
MNSIDKIINWLKTTWNFELIHLTENSFTTKTLFLLILSLFLLFYISSGATTIITNHNIAVIVPTLDFINLRVCKSEYTDRPGILRSEINYAVFKKFRENNILIPFPQRDIHLKSGFEKISEKI